MAGPAGKGIPGLPAEWIVHGTELFVYHSGCRRGAKGSQSCTLISGGGKSEINGGFSLFLCRMKLLRWCREFYRVRVFSSGVLEDWIPLDR